MDDIYKLIVALRTLTPEQMERFRAAAKEIIANWPAQVSGCGSKAHGSAQDKPNLTAPEKLL